MTRSCGECSLCCKLIKIDALNKPANKWCPSCKPGMGGCQVYDTRPQPCINFKCLWLQPEIGTEGMRPDRTHVIFHRAKLPSVFPEEDTVVCAIVDPKYPKAHTVGEPEQFIRYIVSQGKPVFLGIGEQGYVVR